MVMGDSTAKAEVAILGGGPGGYAAAFRAAQRGLDTVLITDDEGLGGVCLLRGCIPSKALLEMTGRMELAREAGVAGIRYQEPEVDPDELRAWCDQVVEGLVSGLDTLAEARNVRVVRGRGHFESSSSIRIEDGDLSVVEFQHAIVATGSRPASLPGVDFGGRVMDSAAALRLESIPERLLVVGAGYVGLELGTVYARLGSRVTVVEVEDRILPLMDPELAEPLAERLGELFHEIRLETGVDEVVSDEDGVTVTVDGEEEDFDAVLVAVGRMPATDDIGLGNTGVTLDDDGYIRVDETRRTDDQRIFAVGDVTGGLGLAHEAMREGKVAADVLAGEPAAFDVRAVPAVVYTDPQIAWCGLDPSSVEAEDRSLRTERFPLNALGRARTMGEARGLVKLTVDPSTNRILGVGMTGRHVESLISEAALALEMGATATDLALTIHPHPTLSEGLSEAAERVLGIPTHIGASSDASKDSQESSS